ncbi:ADP-ribosylglycohydrolase family protein [Flaviaesturariibacter amylovorans]|uniref:ADP-ribosylglycohydrolase family protein n=1 Tax=Flaviaesturariibacter amylovorans TaxID=1084520 RepID=A0ABP8H6N5_9BACT
MQLTQERYFDKVLGGWVGKCAGGILGAPIEGFKRFNNIEINDALFDTNFPNDDLDLQVLWLDMVMRKGPQVRERDFAEHWLAHVGFPWNEYGIATRNLRAGILPPESGRVNNSYWKNSMGCPIRSEIWGMLCAGRPDRAAFYAGIDGSLDHEGFSVHAEQYLSACAAIAFFEEDVTKVLLQALNVIPADCLMATMVHRVEGWQKSLPADVVVRKIKSAYGDADFTSAPMNIAFTLFALFRSNGDFSCITEALHMGHDSDCIVATAGALVGIISGYERIPDVWKRRVGNELLISDAITGITKPATISELAEWTCREGDRFRKYFDDAGTPAPGKYSVTATLPRWDDLRMPDTHLLRLCYENLLATPQQVALRNAAAPDDGQSKAGAQHVGPFERKTFELPVRVALPDGPATTLKAPVAIWVDGTQVGTEEIGIPYFGNWLLLGPFIQDDRRLEPCHPRFPDHGASGLPSVQYMNHDAVDTDTSFLSPQEVARIARAGNWDRCPFEVARVHCASFEIPLQQGYGKGERTLYLYAEVELVAAAEKWISMGCTGLFDVFINEKVVYRSREIRRCWPGAHSFRHFFRPGRNSICIRLTCVIDETRLQFGLKDFAGQHPHQSHWSLTLPHVPVPVGVSENAHSAEKALYENFSVKTEDI